MEDMKKGLSDRLMRCWKAIPPHFRRHETVKRTLQCEMYLFWREMGRAVLADYYPPRISDRPVDIVVLNETDSKKIEWALCIDELITLYAVRSLTSFEAKHRIIFTTHMLEKKVKESTFFLKPEIEHVHLHIG